METSLEQLASELHRLVWAGDENIHVDDIKDLLETLWDEGLLNEVAIEEKYGE